MRLEAPPIEEIRRARERIARFVLRSPLVRLRREPAPARIYLKLENLQPIGSFKLRGAGNAMLQLPPQVLARGVSTASAGNMAQGVAYLARDLGVPCTVVVPETAAETKLRAASELGARIVRVPFDRWWGILAEHRPAGIHGTLVHPVSDPAVIAGNGTIGLEIVEDLPGVEAVVVPYGGGALACGIAAAVKALRPEVKVYASEVAGAAPLWAALEAGRPVRIEPRRSFVDGIGGASVLAEMWPLASSLLDGSLLVTPEETAEAVRLLAERNGVVAEGAGATSVAAALAGRAGGGTVACVVSGGNIGPQDLAAILSGRLP